ncbi:MAG: hypothetical protein HYZ18_10580, partial [Pseudogulbenkiania sp.]|nr:hypothetical protein [Pseudogulbenkiania sp.]
LVQPVLDRNCAACHREQHALDLSGVMEGKRGWTRSYQNLAGQYGFYFHVFNGSINAGVHGGSRTIPGRFGARAAPLLQYLDERHHEVKLSPEDFQRITLFRQTNGPALGRFRRHVTDRQT